ncbi:unnamed protein product [Allacma fusca]|uniref:Uncharacterized protein n=1 Tax=Allacma fusca TaxID=39272 RepID=A0A8J2P6R1_9HEXA|nr:unnamed protein product [Allacma fusca]
MSLPSLPSFDEFVERACSSPLPFTSGTSVRTEEFPTETPDEGANVGKNSVLPKKRGRPKRSLECLKDKFEEAFFRNTTRLANGIVKRKPGRPPVYRGRCKCPNCSPKQDPDRDYVPPTKYKYPARAVVSVSGNPVFSVNLEKHNLRRGLEEPPSAQLPVKVRKPGSGLHMRGKMNPGPSA